ncbi:cytochrome d ubiquinol oxidase subunit II [Streptomyces sp. B6B3]|uniref:cytochrome d ubiquinol oxidase subunit II n=1 Tax=Streptomyces sp. B6B3 TaxID=3153570 RepID=UPI00325CF3F3
METIAASLLGLFAAGYLVLVGASLGLGMLLRFLGRTDAERRRVLAALAPPGRGAGAWLTGTVVVLVGCFPGLAGELFTGLWPIPAVLVAGWLVRAAGLRRSRGPVAGRGHGAALLGSWLLAGGLAWALASVLVGGARRTDDLTGWCAVAAVLLLFLTHGLGAGTRRLTGEPFRRARQLAGPRAGGRSVALTSTVLAVLPPLAGVRLPLSGNAAPTPVLTLLVPPLLALFVVQLLRLRRGSG